MVLPVERATLSCTGVTLLGAGNVRQRRLLHRRLFKLSGAPGVLNCKGKLLPHKRWRNR